jgi:hypothetical protein
LAEERAKDKCKGGEEWPDAKTKIEVTGVLVYLSIRPSLYYFDTLTSRNFARSLLGYLPPRGLAE